ncbi:hypothetical protein [Aeoliella sp.]|uniref:hypothetical protein n=1 Tax=Aeoliella sp. TaxID=2795800 RepID=UPI003CCB8A58
MDSIVLFVGAGCVTGLLAMLLYGKLSPQAQVAALSSEIKATQSALIQLDDSDLGAVWRLASRAVGLSLRQIKLILIPTLCAGLVVLGVAWLIDSTLDATQSSFQANWLPSWLNSGHVAFWVPLTVSALIAKWRFKIK